VEFDEPLKKVTKLLAILRHKELFFLIYSLVVKKYIRRNDGQIELFFRLFVVIVIVIMIYSQKTKMID
jgi:hypothetical protein